MFLGKRNLYLFRNLEVKVSLRKRLSQLLRQVLFDDVMSSSEEDSYSMIFASLKHPIRRKILRILSSEAQTFSDLQKQFKIKSSHLTYHIDGLGNLLYKTEDGKYALSSLGEAAVSMMRNVEEPPTNSHFPFTHPHSSTSEKKVASRAVAIALGIICVVLVATLVGAFAFYVPLINSKNSTISSLNSQVTSLQNQTASDNAWMTNLQDQIDSLQSQIAELEKNASSDNATIAGLQSQLNLLLNWSSSIEDMIMSNPSDWVNRTVIVEGSLSGPYALPAFESSPWGFLLSFGNYDIGVSFSPSVNFTAIRRPSANVNMTLISLIDFLFSPYDARIYGVVKQGEITSSWGPSSEVTYYIEAEIVEPL